MRNALLNLYVKAHNMRDALRDEDGQDLIEYALVVSLIAFAAVAGMNTLASNINDAFIAIGSKLNSSV